MFNSRQMEAIKAIAREISRHNKKVGAITDQHKPANTWNPINHAHAAFLQDFRPSYWTEAGLIKATLHKIDVSQRNGETIAYYDLTVKKVYGATWTRRYIWAIRNGSPKEIHQFDWRMAR